MFEEDTNQWALNSRGSGSFPLIKLFVRQQVRPLFYFLLIISCVQFGCSTTSSYSTSPTASSLTSGVDFRTYRSVTIFADPQPSIVWSATPGLVYTNISKAFEKQGFQIIQSQEEMNASDDLKHIEVHYDIYERGSTYGGSSVNLSVYICDAFGRRLYSGTGGAVTLTLGNDVISAVRKTLSGFFEMEDSSPIPSLSYTERYLANLGSEFGERSEVTEEVIKEELTAKLNNNELGLLSGIWLSETGRKFAILRIGSSDVFEVYFLPDAYSRHSEYSSMRGNYAIGQIELASGGKALFKKHSLGARVVEVLCEINDNASTFQFAQRRIRPYGEELSRIVSKNPGFRQTGDAIIQNGHFTWTRLFPTGTRKIPIEASPVQIAKSASGSGYFLNREGYVLTASHVVSDFKNIQISFPHHSEMLKAELVANDRRNDVAILKVDVENLSLNFPDNSCVLNRLDESQPPILGESIFTIGYPLTDILGKDPTFTAGKVNSLFGSANQAYEFQISVLLQPGNSGGPVFDKNGSLLGVAVSSLNPLFVAVRTGSFPQNVNFSVRLECVETLAKISDLSHLLKDDCDMSVIEPIPLTDVVKKVLPRCVQILCSN